MNRFIRKNLAGYAFLTPWLVGFLLLAIGPILFSLYLSFTKYNVINPPQWIGLENYEYMFGRDARFRKALQVTFTFVAFAGMTVVGGSLRPRDDILRLLQEVRGNVCR